MTQPKAILFDLGGTLDADGVPWKARFHRLLAEEGHDVAASAFDPAFYAADDALVGAVPRDLSFRETVRFVSEGLTRGLGVPQAASALAARFASETEAVLRARTPLLSSLREAHRLGVVSNFYGNLARVLSDTGIASFFETAVDSVVAGFSKPDARIFRTALDALSVAPEDALFVGDSMHRDMAGAKGLGMRHVWLSGKSNGTATCCEGDPVIARLEDLPSVEGILA